MEEDFGNSKYVSACACVTLLVFATWESPPLSLCFSLTEEQAPEAGGAPTALLLLYKGG